MRHSSFCLSRGLGDVSQRQKGVYLDGAGSGSAVIDAFAALSVVYLLVDDALTVTGATTTTGTLTVGVDDTG